MRTTLQFLSTVIGCTLLLKGNVGGAQGVLEKPEFQLYTDDPYDMHMIGGNVWLNCCSSTKADAYIFIKDGKEYAENHNSPNFTMTNLNTSNSGQYSCKYRFGSSVSEESDPQYIYVKDRYEPPTIIVTPHKIVHPGEDVTVTCCSSYSNIVFTIYKYDTPLETSEDNPFSYVLKNIEDKHAGQYFCDFKTKPGSAIQMNSDPSNPMRIQVKDLRKPYIAWAGNHMSIKCEAPKTGERISKWWFQLLNSDKEVEEETSVVNNNFVFKISNTEDSVKTYYCQYAIRIGNDLAYSVISDQLLIADYTMMNIIRSLLSALLFIILGIILVTHFNMCWGEENKPPKLPPMRKTQAVESEYAEMVIMKVEDTEDNTEDAEDNTEATQEQPADTLA
ncbi:immunoglobulin superfamily member 1-like [Hyperolius riggenbachi]|uniref:immunoglobulin superfamily member 1-like n=1 Tax=Hyperolius riggenbachi TaxID=752182 RepID=UPI0035A2A301